MNTRDNHGFSLVELMVVLAILSILGSSAMIAMSGWRERNQLQGAANNLAGDLQLARMRAIRESCNVAVVFDAASYRIFVDTDSNWILTPDKQLLLDRQLPAGISIKANTFQNKRTRYDSTGKPSIIGTVTLAGASGNHNDLAVVLNRVGRLRMEQKK